MEGIGNSRGWERGPQRPKTLKESMKLNCLEFPEGEGVFCGGEVQIFFGTTLHIGVVYQYSLSMYPSETGLRIGLNSLSVVDLPGYTVCCCNCKVLSAVDAA